MWRCRKTRKRERRLKISVTVTKRNTWTGSLMRSATKRVGGDWKLRFNGCPRVNRRTGNISDFARSEEHTSELQSRFDLVCRLLLEKKKTNNKTSILVHNV